MRLAALAVYVAEDAERLAARLRLSNDEQALLALGAQDHATHGLPAEDAAKRLLYWLGHEDYAIAALLAFADARADVSDKDWRAAATLAERWQAPQFPLKGSDLVALGMAEGPQLGAALRTLEAEWVGQGFAADRNLLLARAKAIVG
jgi:poly(A) polymerase